MVKSNTSLGADGDCLCLLVVSCSVYEMTDDLHETRSQAAEVIPSVCLPHAPFHSEDVYVMLAGDVEISMLKSDEYIRLCTVFRI